MVIWVNEDVTDSGTMGAPSVIFPFYLLYVGTSTDEVTIKRAIPVAQVAHVSHSQQKRNMMNSSYSTRVSAPTFVSGREGGNDFTNLNPNGRLVNNEPNQPETPNINENNKKSLFSCTDITWVGTLNTRTIRTAQRKLEMVHLFEKSGAEIVGIQEHRIVHEEPVKVERVGKSSYLITSSATRNRAQAAVGGVGFILTSKAFDATTEITPVTERILKISLNGNPKPTFVCVYGPTDADSVEAAEKFHTDLRCAVSQIPAHNFLEVIGDFNAHLSKRDENDFGWYFHERTNRNGELLRDTALECNLEITNTRFRKKRGKMWTHLSDGTLNKSQLDFILVRKKWRKSVKNTEVYSFFSTLGTDHRLVLSKIKLSLRRAKKLPKKTWYNWGALKSDEDLQKRYAVEVKNRYSALCEQTDESEVTELYGHFVDAIADTNKAILPKREKKRRDDFACDQRVQSVRTALQQAETVYHRDPSEDSRLSVKLLKTELDQVYQDIFEEDLVAKVRRVEMAADRCKNKESWNVINEITGRKAKGATQIRGNGAEERKKNWLGHFTNLLGSIPDVENEHPRIETQFEGLNISTEPFTVNETKSFQ
ncbi:uncharacterized protein LOC134819873 [Bolinopsis microptera]|uniref:uncharacterized protein LOC134819873 n=1 Tax=Bolinopsis microptera TaxID=2820187 RepID=UPI0030791739